MFFQKKKQEIVELKEKMPLEVIEASYYSIARRNVPPTRVEFPMIKTIVYTDGEIFKESEVETNKIEGYYFGTEKYDGKVEVLKRKQIFIKNHTFVVVYTTAKESKIVGNVGGLFDVIKEVKIYLKDANDKKALQSARAVIENNKSFSRSLDYSSPLTMELSRVTSSHKMLCRQINPFEKKHTLDSHRPR